MDTLEKKVEDYIVRNTTKENGPSMKDIFDRFVEQGYSKKEIQNAIGLFFKKHQISNPNEYT